MALRKSTLDLGSKLKMLTCKKEAIFARVNNIYGLSKNISNFESRSNEHFLAESEMLDEFRQRFELLIDDINEISLCIDTESVPNYSDMISFDDMYVRVKHVRNKILCAKTSADSVEKGSHAQNSIKLPPIELPGFDGKTENWPIFYESFRSNIHENSQLSDSQRVQYLVGKLTGNARKMLAGVVPTGDTYLVIWDSLVKKYQDTRALGTHYLNNIFELKNCQNTASSLDSFIEKYSASISALKQLDIPDLADFILMYCALKKIDAQTNQAFELSVTDKEIPSYKDLILFVQNQVKILERSHNNYSSTYNSRVKQNEGNINNKRSSSSAIRAHTFIASNATDDARPCVVCNKVDHSRLSDCSQFKNIKSAKLRFDFIKSKQGCVNCLCLSHTVSACTETANCQICKTKWHHTLLHFDKKNSLKTTRTHIQTSNSLNDNDNCYVPRYACASTLNVPAACTTASPVCLSCANISPPRVRGSSPRRVPAINKNSCTGENDLNASQHTQINRTDISPQHKPSLCLSASSKANASTILLATAQVYAKAFNTNDKMIIRCLIDNGSQNHLITLECCKNLNLHVTPLNNSVIRGVGLSSRPIYGYVDFEIESRYDSHNKYKIHALVVDCITDQLPSHFIEKRDIAYLNNISMADLTWNIPGNVDVVLGAQLFPHIYLGQKIVSGSQAPPALLTAFGYVLMGDFPNSIPPSQQGPSFSALAVNDLDTALHKFWELEEIPSKGFLSPEETECENFFVCSVSRDDKGRYSVALPFCADPKNLGNSRSNAQRRLLLLERKFRQTCGLRESYNTVINEYIEKGYLSEIADSDVSDDGYYIPHHAVVRKDKPMPRIVLDASAKTHTGLSLNDILHSGPNLQADLFLLLLDFRLFPVGMTADIHQMYLQVSVPENCRKYLRILFRFKDDDNIRTFQFNRVPFGLKCSPFLAMRSIRQLASDMATRFPAASHIAESNMYMDDLVHSQPNEASASVLAEELIGLFKSGCMDLIKWTSNSSKLLENLPNSHRNLINFNENDNTSSNGKVLGLSWDPAGDHFFMTTIDIKDKCTKRNILSVVARLFDVLGLVAPVILYAKLLIKELWLAKIGWDELPPDSIIKRFSILTQEFSILSTLRIPRHVGVTSSSEVLIVGFCDASLNGYGCVIYIHVTDATGNVSVRLLCAKSKVSPTKITTLARLELCAAVLLSKLIKVVLDTYRNRIPIANIYAFSDSTIVLSWISSSPHRWSVFVGNRVAQCQENLAPHHFYHISGTENPSDCLSRGMLPSQLASHKLWWNGPQWLQRPSSQWPISQFVPSNVGDLPEHRANVMTTIASVEPSVLYELSQRISSWDKLIRITVYVLRFIKKIKTQSNPIENMLVAEKIIIQTVQKKYFSNDIKLIKNNNLPSKKLRNLSVFIDEEGILRIGGRLSRSKLPFEVKYPVLLPKHDHVVDLIIRHSHELYCHTGPGLLMSILRQKYWILDARTVIRARVRECNACFRVNPSHPTPKMADLPSCRLTEAKAFVHTGVDYAGPIRVLLSRRRGQHAQKAYVCLFVCLVTKAVHIELATELSSDCFLAAFKRFISRRGPVSCMYSDNGTNFVGARAQLDEMYNLMLNSQHQAIMKREFEKHRIEWKMIPPRAPHFGALWESNIKSLKSHLYRIIGSQLLTYEELQTVLVQIECIMNSRPLSVVSSDPHPEVLTPAHFLMSTPLKYLPASDLSDKSVNLVRRKKLLDALVASYWKKWRNEYLHTLQVRQKWQKEDNPIKVGTVVLIGQEDAPPLSWPLGVITEVFPGPDGIVRVATVKTSQSSYKRPIVKLHPLPNQ